MDRILTGALAAPACAEPRSRWKTTASWRTRLEVFDSSSPPPR